MAENRLVKAVGKFVHQFKKPGDAASAASDASTSLLKMAAWLSVHAHKLADEVRALFTQQAELARQQALALKQISRATQVLSADLSNMRAATTVRLTEANNPRILAKPAPDLDDPTVTVTPPKTADTRTISPSADASNKPGFSTGG